MTLPNISSDFDLLSTAANFVRHDFDQNDSAWRGSPFEWVLRLSPATKGRLGKQLVYQWSALKGLSVDRCLDSEADMLINGHRVEVKFSMLWSAGIYRFQQIRDQNYEYAVCLGISPREAHCWVLSKTILRNYVIGHMGQHTGIAGRETAWFPVNPHNPPNWLAPCGGTLEQAFVVLQSLSHRR